MANYHVLTGEGHGDHADVQRDWMWNLTIPDLSSIVGEASSKGIKTRVKNASIPGSDIEPIEVKYMGTSQFFPGKRVPTTEWSSTLIETEDHYAHSAINSWMTLIQQIDHTKENSGASLMASKKNGYALTAFLELMAYDGTVSRKIEFTNVWPKSIGPQEVSYEGSGNIEYSVSFKCDNYIVS
jgi:hypothetical protein